MKKEYKYTVKEFHYDHEEWTHRTDSIERAYKLLTDGTHDASGAMLACYHFGEFRRECYDRNGNLVELNNFNGWIEEVRR